MGTPRRKTLGFLKRVEKAAAPLVEVPLVAVTDLIEQVELSAASSVAAVPSSPFGPSLASGSSASSTPAPLSVAPSPSPSVPFKNSVVRLGIACLQSPSSLQTIDQLRDAIERIIVTLPDLLDTEDPANREPIVNLLASKFTEEYEKYDGENTQILVPADRVGILFNQLKETVPGVNYVSLGYEALSIVIKRMGDMEAAVASLVQAYATILPTTLSQPALDILLDDEKTPTERFAEYLVHFLRRCCQEYAAIIDSGFFKSHMAACLDILSTPELPAFARVKNFRARFDTYKDMRKELYLKMPYIPEGMPLEERERQNKTVAEFDSKILKILENPQECHEEFVDKKSVVRWALIYLSDPKNEAVKKLFSHRLAKLLIKLKSFVNKSNANQESASSADLLVFLSTAMRKEFDESKGRLIDFITMSQADIDELLEAILDSDNSDSPFMKMLDTKYKLLSGNFNHETMTFYFTQIKISLTMVLMELRAEHEIAGLIRYYKGEGSRLDMASRFVENLENKSLNPRERLAEHQLIFLQRICKKYERFLERFIPAGLASPSDLLWIQVLYDGDISTPDRVLQFEGKLSKFGKSLGDLERVMQRFADLPLEMRRSGLKKLKALGIDERVIKGLRAFIDEAIPASTTIETYCKDSHKDELSKRSPSPDTVAEIRVESLIDVTLRYILDKSLHNGRALKAKLQEFLADDIVVPKLNGSQNDLVDVMVDRIRTLHRKPIALPPELSDTDEISYAIQDLITGDMEQSLLQAATSLSIVFDLVGKKQKTLALIDLFERTPASTPSEYVLWILKNAHELKEECLAEYQVIFLRSLFVNYARVQNNMPEIAYYNLFIAVAAQALFGKAAKTSERVNSFRLALKKFKGHLIQFNEMLTEQTQQFLSDVTKMLDDPVFVPSDIPYPPYTSLPEDLSGLLPVLPARSILRAPVKEAVVEHADSDDEWVKEMDFEEGPAVPSSPTSAPASSSSPS